MGKNRFVKRREVLTATPHRASDKADYQLPPLGGIRGGDMCHKPHWLILIKEKQHMPPSYNSLISFLSKITRKNSSAIIQCSHCGNRHCYIKWGYYSRYLFNEELITIQRYQCDNDQCPRKTFSILPHAFLHITRASLCMLMYEQGCCIAQIANETGSTWSGIQRWICKALSIRDWLKKEYGQTDPCCYRINNWVSFTRDFSWTFYPERFR